MDAKDVLDGDRQACEGTDRLAGLSAPSIAFSWASTASRSRWTKASKTSELVHTLEVAADEFFGGDFPRVELGDPFACGRASQVHRRSILRAGVKEVGARERAHSSTAGTRKLSVFRLGAFDKAASLEQRLDLAHPRGRHCGPRRREPRARRSSYPTPGAAHELHDRVELAGERFKFGRTQRPS